MYIVRNLSVVGVQTRKQEFPYAKIECARFKGTDVRVFLDQRTIEGPVYKLAESCIEFVKKNIALRACIPGKWIWVSS